MLKLIAPPALYLALAFAAADSANGSCEQYVGEWLDPLSGESLEAESLFDRLTKSRVVLLGEAHTSAAHHRWQAYLLGALHSRKTNMSVGFEMLPRRAQPVLDAWSRGELGEREFLRQAEWKQVWGYDADLYLPLLHFVRLNRLPAIALNVDRALVTKVGQRGWQALDETEKMGLSEPAPASEAYRDSLAELYAYKQAPDADEVNDESDAANLQKIRDSDAFAHFVEAQLTWDRAMAEALAAAHRRDPSALVVGIVGRGHIEYGFGIPHQLADMGIEGVDVLLPLDADASCDLLPTDLARAVFVVDVDAEQAPPRARLGVIIETADAGVRVQQVVEDSVAADSGIEPGDVIKSAAGFATATTSALIEIIQRQAPGTWLPLRIRRNGKVVDLIAKFPQSFD